MNKRGISEVVSYTLLIVIALTMSIIVYAFLKAYVPKDKPECKDGISIIIENLTCINKDGTNNLSLTLQNTGRFKIDFAYIRIGNASRKIKVDVPPVNPLPLTNQSGNKGLDPSELTPKMNFNLSYYSAPGNYILEVQSAYYTKGTDIESIALCLPITQTITCIVPPTITDLDARSKVGKIQLTWTSIGANYYKIYRSDDNGNTYNKINETTSTYSTYLDSQSLTIEKTYWYYVVAVFDTIETTSNKDSVIYKNQ